ncbi:30S ribosomal protein S1, chloroplastic [Andrographis paniculata]|uniref:30S ribosomal protein S1, chloroplastic n=1 Tax=Andrographis paniculata TaxID=175694 RepID=UPI0021E71D7D|nr:30S ribosomal protein S1, chloroplastic [Andrographis paniculata]
MPVFASTSLSGGLALLSQFLSTDNTSQTGLIVNPPATLNFPCSISRGHSARNPVFLSSPRVSVSGGSSTSTDDGVDQSLLSIGVRQSRRSEDWKAAREYHEKGLIYEGKVEGFNGGGLLIKFSSLVGFLPFPQLSPSHSCKEPNKSIQQTARALVGSTISVKVIQADEESRKLIFSEKEANWLKFSPQLNVGDIFEARVGSVEDYGAFIHLRFPDGLYHLTGLVHVSEVSWDLVQDVRDVLAEGDEVRVKIVNIDREKSRITLSIKQLEEDPLLETIEKVIPQDDLTDPDAINSSGQATIEPLTGLEIIIEELLKEDGIDDVRITRQGFEKRVVSQDLQLWLSNALPVGNQYTLLARAGRQVQEIQLTTSLDQYGIKKALQRVLERVP